MAIDFERFDEWEKWHPSIQGQRELAKTKPDEAASIEIRFMTRVERKRIQRLVTSVAIGATDEEEHDKVLRGFFNTHMRNIRNLTSDGVPITKGGDLLDVDDDHFAFELAQALINRSVLEDGLAKKLRPLSDSSASAATSSGAGDVADAIQLSPPAIQEETTAA